MGTRIDLSAIRAWKLLCFGLFATNLMLLGMLRNRGTRLQARHPHEPFDISGTLPDGVVYGNARHDGAHTSNWFVGHFLPQSSGRRFSDVEMKFSHKKAGATNGEVATNAVAHTLAFLISGKVQVEFPGSNLTLARLGDYTIWKPGVPHAWTAIDNSVVLAVRWPSILKDQTSTSRFA